MRRYIIRRVLLFLPSMLGVTVIIFVLMRLVPGDIAEILVLGAGTEFAIVIMEIIFVVPGMGTSLVQAVSHRDYPAVQAIVCVMALVFLSVNLLIDLLYAWLNPRIRYG